MIIWKVFPMNLESFDKFWNVGEEQKEPQYILTNYCGSQKALGDFQTIPTFLHHWISEQKEKEIHQGPGKCTKGDTEENWSKEKGNQENLYASLLLFAVMLQYVCN